ncbi:nuclease-related domain-containing protein [Nocardia sp. 004]|uniref:nuclease-related domain-containing protein n=1 Tax=Nocardia sp. 004 TaxID=3385978 RepID=UPI0039A184FD
MRIDRQAIQPIITGKGRGMMLVVNGDRRRMPQTEQTAVTWLRNWNTIDGVAISGCYLPDHDNPHAATEGDIVVITPHGCGVIEVKGILGQVSGTIRCPPNGPWKMPGISGSPVHVRAGDANPLDQVMDGTFNLKNLAAAQGIQTFVFGLVLVFAWPSHTVEVDTETLPRGIEVLAGDATVLQKWFHRRARSPKTWTAQQAHILVTALNFGDDITISDLIAEGFADGNIAAAAALDAEPTSVWATRPSLPVPGATWAAAPSHIDEPITTPPPFTGYTLIPIPIAAPIHTRPQQRRHGAQRLGAIAMIVVMSGGLWLFAQWRNDELRPHPGSDSETTQPTIETPPAPTADTPATQPPISPVPEVAPVPPSSCSPFQPGC